MSTGLEETHARNERGGEEATAEVSVNGHVARHRRPDNAHVRANVAFTKHGRELLLCRSIQAGNW